MFNLARIVGAGVVLVVVSACTASESAPAVLAGADPPREVRSVIELAGCERVEVLHDDIWFWDTARGAVCVLGDRESLRVWSYESEGSPAQVAAETYADEPSLAVSVNPHVLVAGDRDRVTRLAESSPDLSAPVTIEPASMTAAQQSLTFCTRSVGGWLQSRSAGVQHNPGEADQLDAIFPGLAVHLRQFDQGELNDLAQQYQDDPYAHESTLSSYAAHAKSMCKTAHSKNQLQGE